MRNIFLAPRSNETSHKNFDSTILNGRELSFFEGFLTSEEEKILSKYDFIKVWGNKESIRKNWDKMNIGDYVLFYSNGIFKYSARVILKKFDNGLGNKLWPVDRDDGKPWPCLFFLDSLKEVNIPIGVLQNMAGYSEDWDRVQGFMRYNDTGIVNIIRRYGSVETFLNQPPEIYKLINDILEDENDEVVVDTSDDYSDDNIGILIDQAEKYESSGINHRIVNSPRKVRVENRDQKKLIAKIEKHSCQVCNWSLEWIDTSGKIRKRIDVDHIVDKAKGGGEEPSNLWVLCPNCHAKKTTGVIVIDKIKRRITDGGKEIKLLHDSHLKWTRE